VSRCPRKCQNEEKGSRADIKSAAYACIILMVESWKKGSEDEMQRVRSASRGRSRVG
jgi:hypothetical protein